MNHSLTTSDQHILSNRDNKFFIILMCLIREQHVTTSEQLENALAAVPTFLHQWQQIAHDLFTASQDGEEQFWLSYDTAALDYPPLVQWRSLVAQSASVFLFDNPPSSPEPSVVTSFQDMQDPTVDWLWQSRLPLGMLTLLDGDPSLSKSLFTIDLAARVSRALPMPDGSPGLPAAAGVILITAEDDSPRTIRQRLLHAGADLSRVFTINAIPVTDPTTGYTYCRTFSLPDDLPRLERAIDQSHARLLILDPTTLLFGQKDTCTSHEVFMHLSLLNALLAKKQVACILLRRPNRGSNHNALDHILNSISFVGLPRTELLIVSDPCNEQISLLVHTRSTIGELAPTLSFSTPSPDSPASPTNIKNEYIPINPPSAPLNTAPTSLDTSYTSPNITPAPFNPSCASLKIATAPLNPSPTPTTPSVSWHGTSPYSSQQILFILSLEPKPGTLRAAILRILRQNSPTTFSPLEMAKQLPHIPLNTLQVTLRRMANDQQIEQPTRGQYCLIVPSSQNHSAV